MKKIELLSPAGDFDCLKAAVQSGADAVYLGSSDFNARYSASNFTIEALETAIDYAHLRGVKVYLTLNTLIKNEEFTHALELAKKAYEFGVDSIIVQDIGLANQLLENFPDLPLHASTQMTCHNLSSAQVLQKAGFKRIVLARELSIEEIAYIKANISCEIEVFIHGALCISYSGQCLYSSLIGGRSGNRGKCAQGCRLPYTLLENHSAIDTGHLLSPKDLCSLELLPDLLHTNIDSFKIEGRMKTPEYVSTVTRIYRKYIDLLYKNGPYIIEEQDKKDLLQVFNRGGFSSGHLKSDPNREFIVKEKPHHIGLYLGNVANYDAKKGHITLTLNESVGIGDTILFENEDTKYTISELMKDKKNIPIGKPKDKVTIGRMKGKIKCGDQLYKLSSKELSSCVKKICQVENIKRPLNAILDIHLDEPITLQLYDNTNHHITVTSEEVPEVAIYHSLTKERLEQQLNKLTNTPFFFKNIKINLDSNVFLPHIRVINELRRNAIQKYTEVLLKEGKKKSSINLKQPFVLQHYSIEPNHKICLLLNELHLDFDYSQLKGLDKLYVPLNYFANKDYQAILQTLSDHFNLYLYLPTILKPNFKNLFKDTIDQACKKYLIKGFVLSNIGYFDLLKEYRNTKEFIGNFTLNIFNTISANCLDVDVVTISPELNQEAINTLASTCKVPSEFIVYGRLPLMTSHYCLLGNTNQCYPECSQKCHSQKNYYLKDRMQFLFPISPDPIQTITTIYNSKILSIDSTQLKPVTYFRIDTLGETIAEMNHMIETIQKGDHLEGKDYTHGNLNRWV